MKDLTPEQFGQETGHRKKFVIRCIKAGDILARDERGPGCKIPRYKIPAAEVERWRERRTVRVATPQPITKRPAKEVSRTTGLLDRKREAGRRTREKMAGASK